MSDIDDLEKQVEDMKVKATKLVFIFVCIMAIVFIASMSIYFMSNGEYDTSYQNCSATVINKETVYKYGFPISGFHYYIFTDKYCFDVDLKAYNQMKINDSVVLEVHNDNLAYLYCGEYKYSNCI